MASATFPQPTTLLTAEEFVEKHGGEYLELVDGIVVETAMPDFNHGVICNWIAFYLTQYCQTKSIGRVATNDSFVKTRSEPDRVRGGDVCFLSYDRWPKGESLKGLLPVVPEVVFEVRSPSDRNRAVTEKTDEYLRAGVDCVVVVDPDSKSAVVHRPTGVSRTVPAGSQLTILDLLPGFKLPLAPLFE